jgi:uncharacterized membrane protein YkgB
MTIVIAAKLQFKNICTLFKLKNCHMRKQTFNSESLNPVSLMRISIGIIYLWFGVLKFFHGYSPAEDLAAKTIDKVTFGIMSEHTELFLLASWECLIAVLLITRKFMMPALTFLFVHMFCTFLPFFFFPGDTFRYMPYGLSLTGQYIVKNIVIVSASMVLWKTERQKAKQYSLKEHISDYSANPLESVAV